MKHNWQPTDAEGFSYQCVNYDCGFLVDEDYYQSTIRERAGDDDCYGTTPLEYSEKGLEDFFGQLVQFKERAEELLKLYVRAHPEDNQAANSNDIDFEGSYLNSRGWIRFKGERQCHSNCPVKYYSFDLPMRYFLEPIDEALKKTAEAKAEAERKEKEKQRLLMEAEAERLRAIQERRDREEYERLRKKFEPSVIGEEEKGYPSFQDGETPLG